MDINKIKELAEVYLQEQVDLLMRFTSVDSESNYVEGNRQVIDMARAVLETIPGVTMEEMFFEGCGTHLIARIKPEHPEGKIILNSHMDTVFPVGYAAKFPPYVDEDNWLHGLGSGDCKAGFAVSAYAVKIASELGLLPNKEIVMLYSCDEEIGSITSRKVFEKEHLVQNVLTSSRALPKQTKVTVLSASVKVLSWVLWISRVLKPMQAVLIWQDTVPSRNWRIRFSSCTASMTMTERSTIM